ncbi:uncharacterized protein LOC126336853 [Schistocerca gregaria]|uniref:uncharacterized protein LOC126336853 n=1 Tax=Schistocerca gregaria TaxID=7010 RepID=UPI00211E9DD0|nr:uncharacterized protein LOC126336853 [Schistocerca gregaria]
MAPQPRSLCSRLLLLLLLPLLAAADPVPADTFVTEGCVPYKPTGTPADSAAEGRWLVLMGFSASNTVRAYCQKVTAKAGSRPGLLRLYWELSKTEDEVPAWLIREKRVLAVSICKPDAPPHLLLLGRKPEYPLTVAARLGRSITGARFRSGFLCTATVRFT